MHRHIVRLGARVLRVAPLAVAAGLAAGALPAVGQAPAADDGPLKVVVVNLDFVAVESPAGKALQARLQQFQNELTRELQERQAAVRAIELEVGQADSLSLDARRALERRYQDAVTQYQRFQQDKQEEVTAMRADGLAKIQQELGPVLEALQAEHGYDLVLNAQNSLIVIFSDRVDITQQVIERLQQTGGPGR